MPKNKVAVLYGAGGAVGGAVARTFAGQGARLLTGRLRAPVQAAAKDISVGGSAVWRRSMPLTCRLRDEHMPSVTERAGRVDISRSTRSPSRIRGLRVNPWPGCMPGSSP